MALRYIKISNCINILNIYLHDIRLLIEPYQPYNHIIKGNYSITNNLR